MLCQGEKLVVVQREGQRAEGKFDGEACAFGQLMGRTQWGGQGVKENHTSGGGVRSRTNSGALVPECNAAAAAVENLAAVAASRTAIFIDSSAFLLRHCLSSCAEMIT